MKEILVFFVVLLTIIGCGKKNLQSKEPTKLIWYGIGARPEDTDKVFEEVNKYLKEKINVTVEYRTTDWGDFQQKMQVMSASGDEYDVVFAASWAGFPQFVSNGAYMPLDELLKNQGKDLQKIVSQNILKAAQFKGELYAIPNLKEMGELRTFRVNKIYLEKYNLSTDGLADLKDFFPLLEVINKNEKGVTPFSTWKEDVPSIEELDYVVEPGFPGAVKMDDKDLKIINQYKNPEYLEFINQYREAYLKGYIPKEAFSKNSTNEEKTSTKWFLDVYGHQPGGEMISKRMNGQDLKIVRIYKHPKMTTSSVTGSMLAISSTSKNPEKAMEFINLLNTDKYLRNLVNVGIEGVHYKKIDDNTIEVLPESKKYNAGAFTLGNLFLTYLYSDDIPNKWEEFKKFNEESIVSPLLGFTFNAEKVKSEITAIMNIEAEYGPSLFKGAVDPKVKIPEMLAKMDKAGLPKVLTEMQRQIDEWKKEN